MLLGDGPSKLGPYPDDVVRDLRRDDADAGPDREQLAKLRRRNAAAADEDNLASGDIQEEWQQFRHNLARLKPRAPNSLTASRDKKKAREAVSLPGLQVSSVSETRSRCDRLSAE